MEMSPIKSVALGRSGLKISSAVMGTMTFGGEADAEESKRMFNYCLDHGVYAFDSANVYNGGRAEELLGQFALGSRNDLVIATKGYFPMGPGANDRGASRRHILAAVEGSLKRLHTDWIDVYFVHRFDADTPMEETIATLESLVLKGSILYWGVSNCSAWQALKLHSLARQASLGGLTCIQPMYSLVKRQCEAEILPMALSEGFGVVTYSALAAGLLTGKLRGMESLSSDARLNTNAMYKKRYDVGRLEMQINAYLHLCESQGLDPVQLALAWVRDNRAVTAPILGARSVAQLEKQLPFVDVNLTAFVREALDGIFPPPSPSTDRSEEARFNWSRRHADR